MNEFDPKSWEGKLVYVYVRSAGNALQNGIPVVEASLEKIHGKTFLSGRAPDDPRDWIAGLPVLIAWDEVIHLLILNSVEDYFDRTENAAFALPSGRSKDEIQ